MAMNLKSASALCGTTKHIPEGVPKAENHSMLEQLPLEVLGMIYLCLDLQSFHAAITTCPRLHAAFACNPAPVVVHLFYATIPKRVRRHAILTHQCPLVRPFNSRTVDRILHKCRNQELVHPDFELPDLKEMVKLQAAVRRLADVFIQQCAVVNKDFRHSLVRRSVSCTERDRVFRALYCLEMLSRLLQPPSYKDGWLIDRLSELDDYLFTTGTLFLALFSPVENVQLACVHDILMEYITPAFDEMKRHAGEMAIGWNGLTAVPQFHNILSLGLCRALRFIKAETHEERSLVAQRTSIINDYLIERVLEEKSSVESHLPYRPETSEPFHNDTDNGPDRAFRWVQFPSRQPTGCIYREADRAHRRWGYALWDERRHDLLHLDVSGGPATYALMWDLTQSLSGRSQFGEIESPSEIVHFHKRDARGRGEGDGESELVYVQQPGFGGGWFGGLASRFFHFLGVN